MNQSDSDVPLSNLETGIRLEWIEPGIAALRFDMPGKSANVMTATMLNDLDRALNALDHQTDLRGLILISAKPRVFVAGADLTAIAQTLDWPDDEIIRFCRRGQEMFERLRKFAAASIAVIDGACLGGGLELALACDYRVATTEHKSILGLPEVKLGLIPGWAGTVRLPRLVGMRRAGELLTSARILTSREALEIGLVDRWVPADTALAEALELARQVFDSEELRQRRLAQSSPIEMTSAERERLNAEMSAAIDQHPELYPMAPHVVWEQVVQGASLDFESACRAESLAMCRVWGSPPCRGLLNVYFLGEHNKKNPGRVDTSLPTRPINNVGLIGLGVMGQSIGRVIAAKSATVLGWDEQAAARDRFQDSLGSSHCRAVESLESLANCDLIIEAIKEDVSAKQATLTDLAALVSPNTIVATNTSTIPLSILRQGMSHPERLVGIHFCHPQLMSLVEVIRSDVVDESVVATAVHWVRSLGKSPVVVADSPGFVVNRLLAAMLSVAIQRFEDGEDYEQVDQALRTFGFRAGPFEIMDIIGIDTVVLAGRAMAATSRSRMPPSPILPKLVRLGRLGRKSGSGFYSYPTYDGIPQHDIEAHRILSAYQRNKPRNLQISSAEEVVVAMLMDACSLVDEQVVSNPRDIDWCLVQGLSFPAHRGGVLAWADQQGVAAMIQMIGSFAEIRPEARIGPTLERWLNGAGPFYTMV